MTVYIEIIFLDNFLLDSLLLWLVSRFSARRKLSRILTVGALGGIYASAASLFPLLSEPFFRIVLGLLMVILCFPRNIGRSLLYFTVFSMLLGGIAFAFGEIGSRGRLLLYSSFIIVILTELLCRTGFTSSESITVEATFPDHSIIFTAEYDSGCVVKDHRGKSVILIDKAFFLKNIRTDLLCSKLKMRKFHISTASGMKELVGIKPQKILLSDRRRAYYADAWLVIAEEINMNGSPAIFGKGLNTESEENKCRHFSESASLSCYPCFRKITAIISTAASRFLRRFRRKRNPPSC